MANIGFVANSLGSTQNTNLQDILSNYGHTVSTSTQAAFTSSTFSGQDLIVVGHTDRDDSSFVADLDTHMDTHGVPVIVMRSDGLSAGVIGRNGSDEPDTTASALGIIVLERRNSGTAEDADGGVTRDESKQSIITDGFAVGHAASDEIMLAEDTGNPITEVADPSDADGSVRENATGAAGTRLLNNSDGFTILVAADAGDSKVGARAGETFSERVVFFGVGGDERIGKDAAAMLNAAVEWVQAATADVYPTSGTQGALFAAIDLSQIGTFDNGTISWTETTPAGTTVTVEVSDDFGASFSSQSNGGAIAVLSSSEDVSEKVLFIKVTLATTDSAETPIFEDLVVDINGENPPLQGISSAGVRSGSIAADEFFLGGQVIWLTGDNAGTSMEVRSWTSATRTLKLFLDMPKAIAAGDQFTIRPGCQKRLADDCVAKFANAANFRGFPFVPGTDFVTRYPDQK